MLLLVESKYERFNFGSSEQRQENYLFLISFWVELGIKKPGGNEFQASNNAINWLWMFPLYDF
jgi:hypothetical protein